MKDNAVPPRWPSAERFPLPLDLQTLTTVVAEPWVRVGDGHDRPRLEGSVFDREGDLYLCFRTYPGSKIMRVTPEGAVSDVFVHPKGCLIGLAVHKDRRLFAADIDGGLYVLRPDGTLERELFSQFPDRHFAPNDLAFDREGNLYFTDFVGSRFRPTGGVYRLDAATDYTTIQPVLTELAAPNGVGFTPDWKQLWISETARNDVFKLTLMDDCPPRLGVFSITSLYQMMGYEMFDSLKVDSRGNCYIGVMYGGRALIVNDRGVPVGNVVVPGRDEGKCLFSPNLALRPGTSEGYLLSSGKEGAWVFRFPAAAPAMPLYSDL